MRIKTSIIATLVTILGACGVFAQKSTEIFIPIGKSPGVSGKYTIVGKVESADADARKISVVTEAGTRVVEIKEDTRIWLDCSKVDRTNETGSIRDCQRGRTVEVKFPSEEKRDEADWIKIRIER